MKEHPILFNTENVKAILENRKTQTRRVIKPQPEVVSSGAITCLNWKGIGCGSIRGNAQEYLITQCPYGQVGSRLWVRETWCPMREEHYPPTKVYKADCKNPLDPDSERCRKELGYKWRPSIFMPRWASRITLEITAVRVERLQEITEKDALAEGCIETRERIGNGIHWESPRGNFCLLWDSLNANPKPRYIKGAIAFYESFPWEDIQETRTCRGKDWYVRGNPWVCPIEFKRVKND